MDQKFDVLTRLAAVFLCLMAALSLTSCNADEKKARDVVEQFLKQRGVNDVKLDLFVESVDMPNKAYISTTVIWNFADPSGEPQKEYLAFLLRREGDSWAIEQNVAYTNDKQKARQLLAGKKG